jgi:hypothetical protein
MLLKKSENYPKMISFLLSAENPEHALSYFWPVPYMLEYSANYSTLQQLLRGLQTSRACQMR